MSPIEIESQLEDLMPERTAPPVTATTVQLKTATQPLHDAAENHPFQRQLIQGSLPLNGYIHYLSQMFIVHRSLEGHIRGAADTHPAFHRVVAEHQFQESYLREDLAYFGVRPDGVLSLPATAALAAELDSLAADRPLALLGCHYVLEGSNNGSKYLSHAVRRAYELKEGPGTRYLDPYGQRQRALWERFRSDLNALSFTELETETLLHGATMMFQGIYAIQEDLHRTAAAPP